MNDITLRLAMKAVIVKDDKVLLVREAATYADGTQLGRYHLPGGRIEAGENFEDALRREVREETGLEIEIQQPIYVGEWRPIIREVPHQIVGVFFICTLLSGEVTLSEEHDDYQWIDPKDRTDFDVMDPENKVLDRYAEWVQKN